MEPYYQLTIVKRSKSDTLSEKYKTLEEAREAAHQIKLRAGWYVRATKWTPEKDGMVTSRFFDSWRVAP